MKKLNQLKAERPVFIIQNTIMTHSQKMVQHYASMDIENNRIAQEEFSKQFQFH